MIGKLYIKVTEAIEVLNEVKKLLEELEEVNEKKSLDQIKMRDIIPKEVCNKSVKMRAYNVLGCKGYLDISVLAFITRVSPEDIKGMRNAGKKSVEYIKDQLSTLSVDWK